MLPIITHILWLLGLKMSRSNGRLFLYTFRTQAIAIYFWRFTLSIIIAICGLWQRQAHSVCYCIQFAFRLAFFWNICFHTLLYILTSIFKVILKYLTEWNTSFRNNLSISQDHFFKKAQSSDMFELTVS